jgi:hypothetical protein
LPSAVFLFADKEEASYRRPQGRYLHQSVLQVLESSPGNDMPREPFGQNQPPRRIEINRTPLPMLITSGAGFLNYVAILALLELHLGPPCSAGHARFKLFSTGKIANSQPKAKRHSECDTQALIRMTTNGFVSGFGSLDRFLLGEPDHFFYLGEESFGFGSALGCDNRILKSGFHNIPSCERTNRSILHV